MECFRTGKSGCNEDGALTDVIATRSITRPPIPS